MAAAFLIPQASPPEPPEPKGRLSAAQELLEQLEAKYATAAAALRHATAEAQAGLVSQPPACDSLPRAKEKKKTQKA